MHWGRSNGKVVGHIDGIYIHVNASKACTNMFSDVYEVYVKNLSTHFKFIFNMIC